MSSPRERLNLYIDVFEHTRQPAQVLPNLTPSQLIEAILEEFRGELKFLSIPADYELCKVEDNSVLNNQMELGRQLSGQERLTLKEKELPLPPDTRPLPGSTYLRAQDTGAVYKLRWQPALIGRSDPAKSDNDRLAVNLHGHSNGPLVSRRHLKITAERETYYIENMANDNPAFIRDKTGNREISAQKQVIVEGEVIVLERSRVALEFIKRDPDTGDKVAE